MTRCSDCPRHLDPQVWNALRDVAAEFASRGIRLFLFGSFASGEQRPGSDLDLGFTASERTSPQSVESLREAIDALPTIRRIDLVDFRRTDPAFARVALRSTMELA